jgi:hypothetical protein
MHLTRAQRSFLLSEQLIGAAFFNLALSALIGWFLFRHSSTVSVWGDPGMAIDLSATSFLLPLITCLVCTPLVRHAVRYGKVSSLGWCPADHPLLRWLPTSLLARSLVLSLLSAVVLTPGILFTLRMLDIQHVSLLQFALCKAVLSCVLAALVTPVAALYVMAEETPALRIA